MRQKSRVIYTDIELPILTPALTSQRLGLQVCAALPGFDFSPSLPPPSLPPPPPPFSHLVPPSLPVSLPICPPHYVAPTSLALAI